MYLPTEASTLSAVLVTPDTNATRPPKALFVGFRDGAPAEARFSLRFGADEGFR